MAAATLTLKVESVHAGRYLPTLVADNTANCMSDCATIYKLLWPIWPVVRMCLVVFPGEQVPPYPDHNRDNQHRSMRCGPRCGIGVL
jgi:hypothetical protein